MNIRSINRGKKQAIEFNGESVDTGIFKTPIGESIEVRVSRLGIDGDTIVDTLVHGGLDQAVYLYSLEDYQWWESELGVNLEPGTFGENLSTEGLDLNELKIGDQLTIGEVVLEISAPRTPCYKLATRMNDPAFAKQFVRAARPGAYARVLKEGLITAGDSMSLEKTSKDFAGVVEVFNVWHSKQPEPNLLLKALQSPIGEHHKKRIQELYDAEYVKVQ